MLKEVRYTGITANTSDYDCPDGELTLCFNMVNDAGALKAMEAPVNKFTVPGGGRVVGIHKTTNSTNYIILQPGTLGQLSERLYWVAENETSGTISLTLLDTDTPISMFRDMAVIGNTLIVADGLGLHYYLWQDSVYKDLGKRPPFVTLEFGMMRCSSGSSVSVTVPSSVIGSYNGSSGRHESTVSDEDIIKATNAVLGQINKQIADASQKGMFTMPFFVRYAYRLFDGSHYWASAPIMMLPITTAPILNAGTTSSAVVGNVKQFWLCYHAIEDGITKLKGWSDIIKGIDVFVTRPIYTFDASANIGQAGYRSKWVNCITSSYALAKKSMEDYYGAWSDSEAAQSRSTDVGNVRPSRPGGSTSGGSMAGSDNITDSSGKFFIGAYSDYQNGASAYSEKIEELSSTDRVWNLKSNENFITDLLSVHDFYLYASLNINNLNVGDNLYECDGLHGRDLSNLLTRPTLQDDFNSHATLIPSILYGFNSRLHMGDITIHPATPFPLRSMKYCTGACPFSDGVSMAVFLRSGGESYEASNTANTGGATNTFPPSSEDFPRFLYYPDATAYRMTVDVTSESLDLKGRYVLPLTSHDYLNGSYWFGGLGLTSKPDVSTEADPDVPYNINRRNRVYYTEAGNPFVMRPANTAAVGNGRVLALCSATAPLSQGQFGQFPLYAFTDEGIWALEVTQTGTISSVRPGPRDVCTGLHGVQQLGGAVAFLSSQGLMILNGLQVQHISEVIDNDCDIKLADIAPKLTSSHHSLALPATVIPFKEYIKGARLAYDYTNRRILCYNPSLSYSYVYSISGNAWSMLDRTFGSTIPSYPDTMLMSKTSEVLSLENSATAIGGGLVITRPMGFGGNDVLKTVDTVIQRGAFGRGSVKSLLYGSRDLFTWHLVWSSTDHFLRGFRGSPYKYFRFALACSFPRKESLSGATVQFTPRLTNRPR